MDSPTKSVAGDEEHTVSRPMSRDEASHEDVAFGPQSAAQEPHSQPRTPEPQSKQQTHRASTPSTPGTLAPFEWADFEARYESALRDADEQEKEILKEAEGLSKYFQAWASAASAHDDERAVKRLKTRQRFVNLSEEKLSQKQQHYEEVVRAFESALALLRSR